MYGYLYTFLQKINIFIFEAFSVFKFEDLMDVDHFLL